MTYIMLHYAVPNHILQCYVIFWFFRLYCMRISSSLFPQKKVVPNLKRLHSKRHFPSSQPKKKLKKECAVVLFQSRILVLKLSRIPRRAPQKASIAAFALLFIRWSAWLANIKSCVSSSCIIDAITNMYLCKLTSNQKPQFISSLRQT